MVQPLLGEPVPLNGRMGCRIHRGFGDELNPDVHAIAN
jgi:hypothetical protein